MVTGRAGLVNSLIQGEDGSCLSGLQGQVRGLLQIGISFRLSVIQPAVFDFPQGMQERPD
jgi:hypothetical protein